MSGSERGPTVSVLVPLTSLHEELRALHAETSEQLEKLGVDYEMLYLVGRSNPEALERARGLRNEDSDRVRVLEFEPAVGEAAMLSAGATRSRGAILITLPPRVEVDPSVLPRLYETIHSGADLVVAARVRGGPGTSAHVQSRLFNRLISWAARTRFVDIASGTRAVRREVFEEVPLYGDFHRYLPLLAERLGFRVREIPAAQHARATRPRVHPLIAYLWRSLDLLSVLFVSRFTRTPLRLFGGVGVAFAAIGVAILAILGTERMLGKPLADRPMLVLGVLLVGLGVQALAIGLLGELLLFFHARGLRDYRVAAIYEADSPPLPRETALDAATAPRAEPGP